nr:hypothetical protein [Bifidobacterium catenulatum]
MTNMALDETSTRLIRAVRAEAARAGVDGKTLAASGLKRDPKYVYERYRFEKPFTTKDLSQIAEFLGITVEDIIKSASLEAQRQKQEVAA